MAKYKPYNYAQSMMMPIILEHQLVPGTLEFAIHYLVDHHVDLSKLDLKFNNDDTGRLAYDPRVLLKVILFAYSRGIIHSRKIEKACCENIIFMALACGQTPDHSTIATFITSMKDQIEPLFCNVLLACDEMNLLGGTTFSLDGCKLPSNASKEWSGKLETLRKKQGKLEAKVSELIERQIQADQFDAILFPLVPQSSHFPIFGCGLDLICYRPLKSALIDLLCVFLIYCPSNVPSFSRVSITVTFGNLHISSAFRIRQSKFFT